MKKASALLIAGFFLILVWSVGAQTTPPIGYFKHGDFFCNSDTDFEKPASAGLGLLSKKFCQPQAAGCQATAGKFCAAGTRNACCLAGNVCGKGTIAGFEQAVCVPPIPTGATCTPTSPGYAGRTKDGKNVCCRTGQEPGPLGRGTNTPYCQPKSALTCAAGEQFVQGAGDYQKEKRCCTVGTVPAHHPNGLPFCARLPLTVLSPNGGEQISKSGLPYLVRWTTTGIPNTQRIKLELINAQNWSVYQENISNTGATGFKFAQSLFPLGQYKFKLSATVDGQTVTDQSDNFFTLTDTTPPTLLLLAPKLGPTTVGKQTNILIRADDLSGVRNISIRVTSQGAELRRICTTQYRSGTMYCSLLVPSDKWQSGAIIYIVTEDNSPNRNSTSDRYFVNSIQLEAQAPDKSGGQSKVADPACYTFNTNLSIGMSGSEVSALQTAFARAGFSVRESGSFDERTASAVSSFQLQYRSELLTAHGLAYPTGYFGPTTRQKMNQLYGCG